LALSSHSSWVRSNFPVEELGGGATSSSTSSDDFSVPVISSMESFEMSMKAYIEMTSGLYLGLTTGKYFLAALASGSGSLRSTRRWTMPEKRSVKS
jgi:hypothetical protein